MSELAEFLLARIAEDETAQRMRGVHQLGGDEDWPDRSLHYATCSVSDYEMAGPAYCNCDGPARILAECEAKLMIVRRRQVYDMPTHQPHDSDPFCIAVLDAVLLELAQVYADHPNFRPDWRVSPVAGSHQP